MRRFRKDCNSAAIGGTQDMKKNPAFGRVGEAVQANREAGGTSKAEQEKYSRFCPITPKLNFDLDHLLSKVLRFRQACRPKFYDNLK